MDLVMPELDGIRATQALQAAGSTSRVLVLTSFSDDQRVRDAIRAGAIVPTGPDGAALRRALEDRDWQGRQAAEDLLDRGPYVDAVLDDLVDP